jgi:AcrR family transcriptional regulator
MAQLTERRKELVASLMKDGIYEAAVEVLGEHGIDGLTMDRVAEAAGVAKGSLYNYFRNKRELIQFVHEKTIEPAKRALEETLATSDPAPRKLESILRMWFEHFATHRAIFDFLFNDPRTQAMLDASKRSGRAEAIEGLKTIFQQGVREGSFRSLDATRTAEIFLGAVIITTEQQAFQGERRPVGESVSTLMELFLKGLEPRR